MEPTRDQIKKGMKLHIEGDLDDAKWEFGKANEFKLAMARYTKDLAKWENSYGEVWGHARKPWDGNQEPRPAVSGAVPVVVLKK